MCASGARGTIRSSFVRARPNRQGSMLSNGALLRTFRRSGTPSFPRHALGRTRVAFEKHEGAAPMGHLWRSPRIRPLSLLLLAGLTVGCSRPTEERLTQGSAATTRVVHAAGVSVASAKSPSRGGATAPSGCEQAGSEERWLTSAGCVAVRSCPGVPGRACRDSCVPFPARCRSCASCSCVASSLCGPGAAPSCNGYSVVCMEP